MDLKRLQFYPFNWTACLIFRLSICLLPFIYWQHQRLLAHLQALLGVTSHAIHPPLSYRRNSCKIFTHSCSSQSPYFRTSEAFSLFCCSIASLDYIYSKSFKPHDSMYVEYHVRGNPVFWLFIRPWNPWSVLQTYAWTKTRCVNLTTSKSPLGTLKGYIKPVLVPPQNVLISKASKSRSCLWNYDRHPGSRTSNCKISLFWMKTWTTSRNFF